MLFPRFAATFVQQGVHKHRLDALGFAEFLLKQADAEGLEGWKRELLRYESLGLQAADPAFRWKCAWFRHAIRPLARSIALEEAAPRLLPRPTLAIWFRSERAEHARHLTLTWPFDV